MITTRTFKSGNSVAVRLPKALGIREGTEMRVREEEGRYLLEPVAPKARKIELDGIYGAIPELIRQPLDSPARDRGEGRS